MLVFETENFVWHCNFQTIDLASVSYFQNTGCQGHKIRLYEMDQDVKKQRRRSIRNIRKSARFVPPAVSYGSAWIGDNQETNICNLVTSLEELNCCDDLDDNQNCDSNCSRPQGLMQCNGDEACDGFPKDLLLSKSSCHGSLMLSSDQNVQRSFNQNDVLLLKNVQSHVIQNSPVRSTSCPSTLSPHFRLETSSKDDFCVDEIREPDMSNHKPTEYPIETLNNLNFEKNRSFEQHCLVSEVSSHTDSILYENNTAIEESLQQSDTNIFAYDVERNQNKDVPLDDVYSCESMAKAIYLNNVQNDFSNISHRSLNNSLSPEFTDFCPNSAESTPTDPMNNAIRSFFDVSSSSLFNMSFSPMSTRPDTPKATSCLEQVNNSSTEYPMTENSILRKSISDIISSLDDPIISSDPDISPETNEDSDISSCISDKATPMSPGSPEVVTISNHLDSTYTLEKPNVSNCARRSETFPKVAESQSLDDELHIEKFMLVDFDFVKTKRPERRTSNLFTPSSSLFLSDECSNTLQNKVDEHEMDILSSKSSLESNNINDDVLEGGEKTEGLSLDELNFNPPSLSALIDCLNMVDSDEKNNCKKQRRKSNRLALLLEESERFVVQNSSNQQTLDGLQCGNNSDKENEDGENMDIHECLTSDKPCKRSVKTRRGRKSWDLRKESKSSVIIESSVAKDLDIVHSGDSESCTHAELEAVKTLYGKQKYVEKSPQPLETIKEVSNEKNVFLKKKVKRYLNFGTVSEAKNKKRTKKALSVYNGRQCYFPITEQEFDRKMLDVQIVLDSDLDCFV